MPPTTLFQHPIPIQTLSTDKCKKKGHQRKEPLKSIHKYHLPAKSYRLTLNFPVNIYRILTIPQNLHTAETHASHLWDS